MNVEFALTKTIHNVGHITGKRFPETAPVALSGLQFSPHAGRRETAFHRFEPVRFQKFDKTEIKGQLLRSAFQHHEHFQQQ